MTDGGSGSGNGSLARVVAILDVFAGLRPIGAHPRPDATALGVSDLSRALDLSKGTVSRYLRRLEAVGLLERLPDRRYALTTRVYHWGQAATPGTDLRRQARAAMEALAAPFGETVSLFVLDHDAAVCIEQVDGRHPVRLSAAVGRRLPLHAGASPRLLLAFAPVETQQSILARAPFPALTARTMTTAAALRAALEQTRRVGHVVSESEADDSAIGIAAPIRDGTGRVRASLSVAGPASRLGGARRHEILTAVRAAAATVSRSLGHLAD